MNESSQQAPGDTQPEAPPAYLSAAERLTRVRGAAPRKVPRGQREQPLTPEEKEWLASITDPKRRLQALRAVQQDKRDDDQNSNVTAGG
jgi:hypothetical protein